MVFSFEVAAIVVSIIWLIILSFFFFQLSAHYNKLTRGISNKTLKSFLDHTLDQLDRAHKDIDELKQRCAKIEKDGLFHIQRIGLQRFNPFKDTGGDQSFILSLVDANDTGVVISGLYSRSGTRWYAKKVASGKGVEHELSEEEKKAIKNASHHE